MSHECEFRRKAPPIVARYQRYVCTWPLGVLSDWQTPCPPSHQPLGCPLVDSSVRTLRRTASDPQRIGD